MNAGRPMFSQAVDLSETERSEQVDNERKAHEEKRKRVKSLHGRLMFSGEWGAMPQVANQATAFPDTVRVVGERFHTFWASSDTDQERYSEIRMSHLQKGRYVITSEEKTEWDEHRSDWRVLLRVQERQFRRFRSDAGNRYVGSEHAADDNYDPGDTDIGTPENEDHEQSPQSDEHE